MSEPLKFEEIGEGEWIEPLAKGEITKRMLIEYGDAAMDGNPMHTDDEFARDAGYRGVFAQGMLGMGFLGQFLVARFGIESLKRIKVRFAKLTWPDEIVTCRGLVAKKQVKDGKKLVEMEIHTENQEGERKLVGNATIELP